MNRFTLFLTKKYLHTINAEYKCVSKVRLTDDLMIEVVIFLSKNDFRLGQATLTRAIIVHEKCFDDEDLLSYVIAHEYSHHRSWFSYIASFIVVIFWGFGLLTILYSLATLQVFGVIFSLFVILIGCAISWIIEYNADSGAIRILGINQVTSAREVMENMHKPPLVWKIISRMTHPPFHWTLVIYKLFHRDEV